MNLSFRKAKPDDAKILNLWDTQQHVIDCDPDTDWNWEEELLHEPEWREQWLVEIDGRPLGFVQIIDPREEESHYWGEVGEGYRAIDIWIGSEEDLGKGYGTRMMEIALSKCFENPEVKEVWIDPLAINTKAIRFYEKLGFRFVEDRRFGEEECKVYSFSRDIFRFT